MIRLGFILTILQIILFLLLGLIALLLIAFALPLSYGIEASMQQGKISCSYSLTWGWFVKLDRLIAKMMPKADRSAGNAKRAAAKPNGKPASSGSNGKNGKSDKSDKSGKNDANGDRTPVNFAEEEAVQSAKEEPEEDTAASITEAKQYTAIEEADAVIDSGDNEEDAVGGMEMLNLLWSRRSWLMSKCSALWGLLHLTPFNLQGVVGLGEPFTTSVFFRKLILFRLLLPKGIRLDLSPDFVDFRCDLQLNCSGWLSPLQIIWRILLIVLDSEAKELYNQLKVYL